MNYSFEKFRLALFVELLFHEINWFVFFFFFLFTHRTPYLNDWNSFCVIFSPKIWPAGRSKVSSLAWPLVLSQFENYVTQSLWTRRTEKWKLKSLYWSREGNFCKILLPPLPSNQAPRLFKEEKQNLLDGKETERKWERERERERKWES